MDLMGPSIEAGADEASALEFAWPLLYREPEKSVPEENSLPSFLIGFEYDWAASLLLQASRQRGSPFKIEQALQAMRMVARYLVRAVEDPSDDEARPPLLQHAITLRAESRMTAQG
jgi:hypothetical protein